MEKIILGFAGEMASGKGTAAKHLTEKYNASSHTFSTMLRNILDRLYLEQSRENLQTLSTALRKNFCEDIMANVMVNDVKNDENTIITIDGIRRLEDIKHLRELPHFKLIYIETGIRKRYERIIKRSENTDDQNKTFEEFEAEQNQEAESQIKILKEYSDFVIENNGTKEELHSKIDKIIESLR